MLASRRFIALVAILAFSSLSVDVVGQEEPIVALQSAETPLDDVGGEVIAVAKALRKRHTGLRPEAIDPLARAIVTEAHRNGFTPRFVLAVIHVESSGYNYAMTNVGALGLMQLLPTTAESVATRVGVEWEGAETLFDPVANVRLGTYYLARLVRRFDDLDLALAAYNWGPTAIAKRIRKGQRIPVDYVHKVQTAYRQPLRGFGLRT